MAADYARAEASNLSKEQVFALAESIAKQLNFQPAGDIYDAVSQLGGKVKIQDTLRDDPEHTGSLLVEEKGRFDIVIPSHTSPQRDRFTIAHELGHYVLHYLYREHHGASMGRMMAMRRDSHRVEWEANWFAAAFLMPSEAFKLSYQKHQGNVDQVASDFQVSRPAAEIRAKSLELAH